MRLFRVKWSRSLAILVTSLALFALAGCSSSDFPQHILLPASPAAQETADLFYIVFWVALLVFLLVEGLLVYFVLRYQRRAQDEHPEQYHGNTKLEITWTLIPAVILAVMFALTIRTMGMTGPTAAPAEGIKINVAGHQWWWEIQYEGGKVLTASELHMPAGQVMNVSLSSLDVIHSFWVPSIMGKTDTVPGHNNVTWLLSNQPGTYDGQCAEFCGEEHANMKFRVIVQTPQEFQAWLTAQQAPPVEPAPGSLEERGKQILTNPANGCMTCHTIAGTPAVGVTGPNLTHFASRGCFAGCMFENNHDNLTRWLLNPGAMKPGNVMAATLSKLRPEGLSTDEVAALTAYLESLR